MYTIDTSISQSVIFCARCGGVHAKVIFKPLRKPIVDNDGTVWDYWALCPETGEPILLRVESRREEECCG